MNACSDLTTLRELLARREAEAESALVEGVQELVKNSGVAVAAAERVLLRVLDELAGGGVKYQDPGNPGNTWTGRGRLPNWLRLIEEKGGNREDFRVMKKSQFGSQRS